MKGDEEKDTSSEGGQCDEQESVYSYGASGIEERHGRVPTWLWGVAAVLLAWGIYYLVAYWSPPA